MYPQYNTKENFEKLVEKGDIVQCPKCEQYNAYAYMDVNMDTNTGLRLTPEDGVKDGGEAYTNDEILTNWPDVYHISVCSGMGEWTCGNCTTPWMDVDSPLNNPCYTHSDEE